MGSVVDEITDYWSIVSHKYYPPMRMNMYFTLLFEKDTEGPTLAYDLVYHPTPVWCKNGEWLVNPRPVRAFYETGTLEYLLNDEKEKEILGGLTSKNVGIICHYIGHGRIECLLLLLEDLYRNGFIPEVISKLKDEDQSIVDGTDWSEYQ